MTPSILSASNVKPPPPPAGADMLTSLPIPTHPLRVPAHSPPTPPRCPRFPEKREGGPLTRERPAFSRRTALLRDGLDLEPHVDLHVRVKPGADRVLAHGLDVVAELDDALVEQRATGCLDRVDDLAG